MDKRGMDWSIVTALILGIIVLGIVLFFIFQEYFAEDTISRETCRQSVILRGNVPDIKAVGWTLVTYKEKFPLKCKTEVVEINYKDVPRAEKEIGDAMVFCWWLYGNGDFRIFPENSWKTYSTCIPCARFHFSRSVADYYVKDYKIKNADGSETSVDNRINMQRALMTNKFNGTDKTYFNYLQTVGGNIKRGKDVQGDLKAFPGEVHFKESDNTVIDRTANEENLARLPWDTDYKIADLNFPMFFTPKSHGDLIIDLGQFVDEKDSTKDVWASYLFYYFSSNGNLVTEQDFIGSRGILAALGIDKSSTRFGSKLCENFDGIPA
jgi:hypothetical protein